MSGNPKKIIAFNYFGGKFTWLEYLYKYFPENYIHFADVFAGSFVVSLNLQGNVIRTANDINSDITNFFEVLRDNKHQLLTKLALTPCSEEEYNNCWEVSPDKVEQARRFYVRVRQSFFGLGAQRKNKGFHMAKSQLNAAGGETVSRWNNALLKLHDVADAIRSNFQTPRVTGEECYTTRAARKGHKAAMSYLESHVEYLINQGFLTTPSTIDIVPNQKRIQNRKEYRKTIGRKWCPGSLTEQILTTMMPTPSSRDWKGCNDITKMKEKLENGEKAFQGQLPNYIRVSTGKTSQLSPLFVAQMMGFPTYWTVLPFLNGAEKV